MVADEPCIFQFPRRPGAHYEYPVKKAGNGNNAGRVHSDAINRVSSRRLFRHRPRQRTTTAVFSGRAT
jgi:hypothetical protein